MLFLKDVNKMKNKKLQYWSCLIGPADPNEYKGNGADGPLRGAVRNVFFDIFGHDKVCASGWGIDQERYDILRNLDCRSTAELKKLIKTSNNEDVYNLEDIISAVEYGFKYHRDSQNNNEDVPIGNILQWIMGRKNLLSIPKNFEKYMKGKK